MPTTLVRSNLEPRTLPLVLLALALSLLTGCTRPLVVDETLLSQMAENACINRCQSAKDSCDADARYDYRQCEAGYSSAQQAYRRCRDTSWDDCGYPWWDCAENRYGYCTNRYWECHQACRSDPR